MTYNESEDAYYIQHGADAVPKKLGSSGFTQTQIFSGNSLTSHAVDVSNYDGYKDFTLDNFCLKNVGYSTANNTKVSASDKILDSYDAVNGVLHLAANGTYYYTGSPSYVNVAVFTNYDVVLIQ